MQVAIPVAYSVCDIKLDKINHWICVHRIFSCDGILKYKLKVGLVIGCAKTQNETTVYSHFNKTINYVTGTKAKPLDFGLT
jgi:hypothetical protein